MFSDNNRISTRQVFRLFVFDFIGMSTLVLPGVLAQMTGCDGLFAMIYCLFKCFVIQKMLSLFFMKTHFLLLK